MSSPMTYQLLTRSHPLTLPLQMQWRPLRTAERRFAPNAGQPFTSDFWHIQVSPGPSPFKLVAQECPGRWAVGSTARALAAFPVVALPQQHAFLFSFVRCSRTCPPAATENSPLYCTGLLPLGVEAHQPGVRSEEDRCGAPPPPASCALGPSGRPPCSPYISCMLHSARRGFDATHWSAPCAIVL